MRRFIAIIVSTSRSRMALPGMASATPVSTRWRRPDSSRMQARSVSSSSTLGRMRRPTATTVSAARTSASGSLRGDRFRFLSREAQRMLTRKLALRDALVDIGGNDPVGNDSDAGEQVETARTRGSEDQPHVMGNRAVLRVRA